MARLSPRAAKQLREMFDEDVLEELRRQFDAADTDGSGTLDAEEACRLFASSVASDSSQASIDRTAKALFHQMDMDNSGALSFKEYCFRFGRRYQMEAARKRRAAASGTPSESQESNAAESQPPRQREEAQPPQAERATGSTEPRSSSSSTASSSSQLAVGARVSISGLRGATELNNQCGKVTRIDAASGRCIVELDGGGGQKSIRTENVTVCTDAESDLGKKLRSAMTSAKRLAKEASAQLQVWLAGYDWWQLALGGAFVVLIIAAYWQNSAKHASPQTRSPAPAPGAFDHGRRGREQPDAWQHTSAGAAEPDRDFYADVDADYRRHRDDRHPPRDDHRRQRRHAERDDYDYHDDYHHHNHRPRRERHGSYYDDDYGYGGGGGLLSSLDPTTSMLVVAGLGYLCWKGIIPVHRMNFFQLMMLWNMVEPLLFGGRRRRSMGYPMGMGFGMPRRGFF